MNQAAVTAERYPVPPEDLRWRATGMADAEGFLLSGSAAVDFLDKEALGRDRKSFRDFSSILDFGCGCGRLIRSLRPLCDQWASIHGCDIDPAAIAWCKENIPDASFSTVGETPPLHFQDKSIDLIYACSVFTHFDADNQFRWLAELQRIMKPGGYLLLTFRYRHNIELIADQAVRDRIWTDLDRDGIAFMTTDLWKDVFPSLVRRGVSYARLCQEKLGQLFRGLPHHAGRSDRPGDRGPAGPRVDLPRPAVSAASNRRRRMTPRFRGNQPIPLRRVVAATSAEPRRCFRRRPGWRSARHRHRARTERRRLRRG